MEKIYQILPDFFQNILISIFNILAYKKRYGGNYKKYLKEFNDKENLSIEELQSLQLAKFKSLFNYAKENSKFYKELYSNIDQINSINDISKLPIVDKEMLRTNIQEVYTISKAEGIVGKTGGTTGKSLEVIFTNDNTQERFAMLDNFRSSLGYSLGKKTAWFSGKHLLTKSDITKNRFWKTDYFYNVRYYSTFHIKDDYMKYYVEDLIKYKPEFMVGFPSSILEIANYGIKEGIDFPPNVIKAVFPTAETVTALSRNVIEGFFKTKIYDQYASSEGAPFIFECSNNKLHFDLLSGVFEVLDDNNNNCDSGKLIVTSFTTYGTPLIRYDIGDSISLSNESCSCGNNNPLVKEILGRIDDYVYSPQNGKINLGNVSNTLKDTKGIIKFQAIQNKLDFIEILVVVDSTIYDDKIEKIFLKNWKDRMGEGVNYEVKYVADIPVEKSGKYRMVKNNIKNLIEK